MYSNNYKEVHHILFTGSECEKQIDAMKESFFSAPSISSDFIIKNVQYAGGKSIKWQIRTLSSQEKFLYMAKNYLKNASMLVICYDFHDEKAIELIKRWYQIINGNNHNVPIMIACNQSAASIKTDQISQFAASNNIFHLYSPVNQQKQTTTPLEQCLTFYLDPYIQSDCLTKLNSKSIAVAVYNAERAYNEINKYNPLCNCEERFNITNCNPFNIYYMLYQLLSKEQHANDSRGYKFQLLKALDSNLASNDDRQVGYLIKALAELLKNAILPYLPKHYWNDAIKYVYMGRPNINFNFEANDKSLFTELPDELVKIIALTTYEVMQNSSTTTK